MDIIDRARAAGQPILVHCQCGVARSATVIIAYVMKTFRLPMQEAYDHVKQLAPAINPNLSLLFQLREFEQALHAETKENTSGLLSRASSISTWKRKLSKTLFQPQPQPQPQESREWWKSKKVTFELNEPASPSVCY
ncbi:Dual-specificity protein phosphatase SDP1 [Choanephora cucurbitarum]|uniref:protein-tyrosine-phosphatase n=1 Tax=Choanephora cucurbitarum TaxID=101091 RepID=A0A1C7MYY4_9FUNG|nr:Dual-specificity protein phosphatase SDP1 [Choanephora cucurbitarum]